MGAFGGSDSSLAHELDEVSRLFCVGVEFLVPNIGNYALKLVPGWRRPNRLLYLHLLERGRRRFGNGLVIQRNCKYVTQEADVFVVGSAFQTRSLLAQPNVQLSLVHGSGLHVQTMFP